MFGFWLSRLSRLWYQLRPAYKSLPCFFFSVRYTGFYPVIGCFLSLSSFRLYTFDGCLGHRSTHCCAASHCQRISHYLFFRWLMLLCQIFLSRRGPLYSGFSFQDGMSCLISFDRPFCLFKWWIWLSLCNSLHQFISWFWIHATWKNDFAKCDAVTIGCLHSTLRSWWPFSPQTNDIRTIS